MLYEVITVADWQKGVVAGQYLQAIRDDVRPTWFNRRVRATREAAEDQLPARFVTVAEPARTLFRGLYNIALKSIGAARKKSYNFV